MSITKQVWPLVVKDMLERNEEGAVKYNRYLQTDCPDNMLQHAYEEALDLCVYLKTQIEKQKQIAEKQYDSKKEQIQDELKRLQQMDRHNCDLSRCGQENIQRDPVPSSWIIF